VVMARVIRILAKRVQAVRPIAGLVM
jgi:hypothetical protein